MAEINIRLIESNAERDFYGSFVPNYKRLKGRDIYISLDADDMPIKGTHRIPELPMPEYTAPALQREKVEYQWDQPKRKKSGTV